MSKIELICLGGQDEKQKCCQALVIDGDIYVFNAGISTPAQTTLGVQKSIPDFSYLFDNKDKVKGIFVSSAEYNNFGALEFLIDQLPKVPIYTSYFGRFVIESYFKTYVYNNPINKNKKFNLTIKTFKPLEKQNFSSCEITAFRTTSYFLNSLGWIFTTADGSIIYLDQFIVSTGNSSSFNDLINEINKITNKKNLLLLAPVGTNINHFGFTSPNYSVSSFFDNTIIDSQGRVVVAIDACDWYKLISLAAICAKKSIPFYIHSKIINDCFDYLLKNKIISLPTLLKLKPENVAKTEKAVIVISSYRQQLVRILQEIVDGEDKTLTFKPNDTFVYALHTENGYEKVEANIFDNIKRLRIGNLISLPKDILLLSQSQEDHKFIINLLKPKYLIPLNGLYMYLNKYKSLTAALGINKNNVLLVSNGFVIHFKDGLLTKEKKHLKLFEQYINSRGINDFNSSDLFECEQMATNGCVLVSLLLDKDKKQVLKYNYNSVGVTNVTNEKNKELLMEINKTLNEIIVELLKQLNDNHNGLSREQQEYFKKQVIKQFDKKFGKKPLVLLTIIYNHTIKNIKEKDKH